VGLYYLGRTFWCIVTIALARTFAAFKKQMADFDKPGKGLCSGYICVCISYSEAKASVLGKSNKLGE